MINKKIIAEKIATLTGHNSSIFSIIPYKSPNLFLSGAGDGWIVAWNFNDPEMGHLVAKVETQIFSLCYLADANKVIAGNMNGGVHWVDLANPTETKNVLHHQKGVFAIQQIGDSVLTAGGAGMLTRWDIAQQKTIESLHLSNQSLRCIAYSKLRNEIAVGASDHNIYLLNATTLAIKQTLKAAHENSVFTIKYSPNQQFLISGGRDAHLRVRDLHQDGKEISFQPAHWYTINDIAFHPKATIFATASRDKTIKIWDSETYQLLKVIETVRDQGHLNSVNRLFWSTFNDYLVSCGDDRSIMIWNIKNG
ncbi:MAG: WD40 repeat domain-containing protein [Saprospiraceae bacterium]